MYLFTMMTSRVLQGSDVPVRRNDDRQRKRDLYPPVRRGQRGRQPLRAPHPSQQLRTRHWTQPRLRAR